jgi:hypothetical protein
MSYVWVKLQCNKYYYNSAPNFSFPEQNQDVLPRNEGSTMQNNVAMLQLGVREKYRAAVDAEHHYMPPLVRHEITGRAGRPKILIDEGALEWAAGHATTSAISRYFGVSRQTIQNRLITMGLREPQEPPFVRVHLPSETYGMYQSPIRKIFSSFAHRT